MKLIVVSSILTLFRTADVAYGSGIIRGSGSVLIGSDADDAAMERKLEVSNLFADNSRNNGQGVQPKRDITLTMSTSQAEFAAAEPVAISITVKNNDSATSARILNWINPCNGAGDTTSPTPVDMSFFDVKTSGGQRALYLGALIKRKEPTDKDYKTLKAGEQISCTINLDKYFQFTAPSSEDEYEISYAVTSMQLSDPFKMQGNSAVESLATDALNLKINARVNNPSRSLRDQYMRGLQTGSTTFNKCTTAQQGLLREARKQASVESTHAVSNITSISLWGNTTKCARHNKWFGPYDINRLAELKPGYEAVSARLNDASILFDCGCKQNYYAYVYPSNPYRIYLCKVFWGAPMNGTDSKMGTIIHEMSHFTVAAGTDDYAYGQTACQSLAASNPQKAVNNADSHEYFAENTPKLNCAPY